MCDHKNLNVKMTTMGTMRVTGDEITQVALGSVDVIVSCADCRVSTGHKVSGFPFFLMENLYAQEIARFRALADVLVDNQHLGD